MQMQMPLMQSLESRSKHTQELQTYQKRVELMNKQLKQLRERFNSEVGRLEGEVEVYKSQERGFGELEAEVTFINHSLRVSYLYPFFYNYSLL